jgi:hypothetical protein
MVAFSVGTENQKIKKMAVAVQKAKTTINNGG